MRPLLTQPSRIHLPLLIFLAAAALLPLDIQAQGLIPVRVLSLDDVGGAYFGMDVKGIGDCDGDGVPDFAVDAPGTRVNLGPPFNLLSQNTGVYVYSGLNGRLIMDTNLHPGLPPLIYPGAARRVASLGDVDGDGLSDIVVGIQQDIIIDSVVAFGQLNSGGTLLHTHNSPYNPIIPSVWGLTPSITHYPPPADPPPLLRCRHGVDRGCQWEWESGLCDIICWDGRRPQYLRWVYPHFLPLYLPTPVYRGCGRCDRLTDL